MAQDNSDTSAIVVNRRFFHKTGRHVSVLCSGQPSCKARQLNASQMIRKEATRFRLTQTLHDVLPSHHITCTTMRYACYART
mmetsp:Transcript_8798/g.23759  ORF Transcript_8798/g.23759 Transcript_8798/m.23759 type:complete len:82 (-) Transcript_8798:251-496(-)